MEGNKVLKTILFDAYGTLISTGTGSIDAAQKILLKNGCRDVSAKVFYARWKDYHRQHMHEAADFVNEEMIFHMDLRRLYRDYGLAGDADEDVQIMLNTLGQRTAFPETKAVLDFLRERFTVCIASTTDTRPLLSDLKRNNLQFDHIFTSESLRAYKPDPIFYTRILDALNADVSQALFVGDSLTDDVFGPQQLGIRTCWLNRKGAARGNIVPDDEIDNLSGLIDVVKRMGCVL